MSILAGVALHIALFLAFFAFAPPLHAEGLDAGIDRAFEIHRENPGEAIDFLARSLAAAEETRDEDPYLMAEGYFYLGRFRSSTEALPEAEEVLRRAIELVDSLGEQFRHDPLKIDAMELLGQVVGRQQRLANAVDIFNRVLQMQATAKGRTHPDRLRSMQYMAITFEAGQSWRAAEYYWRTALGVAIETGMPEDDVSYYRESLARNLDRQERRDEAERIRGGESVVDVEGAITAALEVGEALRNDSKIEEAHAQFQKVRADFATTAGDSLLYMLVLKDVAETGNPEEHGEQAALYDEAIAIQDRMFGLEPGASGEIHFLAARAWAFHGDFPRAFRGFNDLDGLGGWVDPKVGERQRAVRTIMEAALREPGAAERCAIPVSAENGVEILYAGYVIERVFADLGRNASRPPALDCALAQTKEAPVEEKFRFVTLLGLGYALIETAEYERANRVFEETLASAEKAGRPAEEIRLLLGGMAVARGWTRHFDEGLALVDQAEAIGGASDLEKLSLLRARVVILINATRFPEAEAVLGETLALADRIPPGDRFDDDRAAALNDLVTVLTRAGRHDDALALNLRIGLPDALPADARPSQTIFYLDIRQTRMMLLFALDRGDEAMAAVAAFRDAAIPVADRLLANPERNVILAGAVASTMTTAAVALAGLDLHDAAEAIAGKAAELIAGDGSEGVRLLAARNELVRAYAALVRGEPSTALAGFDRALEAGLAILPGESDEMLEMWAGRGMARLGLARGNPGQAAGALDDLRKATEIARQRIGRESRFDDTHIQRTMRPAFETLVGSAWLTGNPL